MEVELQSYFYFQMTSRAVTLRRLEHENVLADTGVPLVEVAHSTYFHSYASTQSNIQMI